MNPTCSVPSCIKDIQSLEMCTAHYLAWRKSGAPRPALTPKACAECSQTFTPKRGNQKFCGKRCNDSAHRDSSTAACGMTDCAHPVRAKGLCRKHYNELAPNRKTWKKNGDPEVRRAALRRKTQQRRARTKGDPDADLIDRDLIGDRDGWRCGLCATPVDKSLPYPNPRSASLDHIEPLSLGGKHITTNVQIAHLDCNVAKGNRVADVQPLLVG